MSEDRFWQTVQKGLSAPRVVLNRVENGLFAGMPDVFYCFPVNRVGWMELKYWKEPKRRNTPMMSGNHPLMQDQCNWHLSYRRAGGNSWVLIGTESRILLMSNELIDEVKTFTLEQMVRMSSGYWLYPMAPADWANMRSILCY